MIQTATSHPCPPLAAPDRPTTGYSGRLAPSSDLFTVNSLAKPSSGHQDRAGSVAPALAALFLPSWRLLAPGNCLSTRERP